VQVPKAAIYDSDLNFSHWVLISLYRYFKTNRESFYYIKSCRPFIAPNESFKVELAVVEAKYLGSSSVTTNIREWDFYEWNRIKSNYEQRGVGSPGTWMDICCSVS
jgi:hypothetical protein